jgi:rhodanese-related sulfurtransferase
MADSTHPAVRTIIREELLRKMERHDDFKLVMASSEWSFKAKHLPGSLHFHNMSEMLRSIGKDDEVVVYCSNIDCNASLRVYRGLVDAGYTKAYHYTGGLLEWEAAGLPLEGTWTDGASGQQGP